MAENKVRFLRGTAAEYADAIKDDDTFYYTTDDEKFYVGSKEITGGGITVDSELSDTSTNPAQNKVIKAAIDDKADKTVATTEADGLMSASDKTKLDNADDIYALKSKYGDMTINVGRMTGTDVGICSDAEGWHTTASGDYSHTEGLATTASNRCSHAEGVSTVASGEYSHAEGVGAVAFGDYSHARGYNTITNNTCETASGKYNVSNDNTLFSIGDGTADDARHNAFEITTDSGKLHDKDIATMDDIHTHSNKSILDATTASFTTSDKTKLDGIATGATKISVDTALSSTSTNPLQNKVLYTTFQNYIPRRSTVQLSDDFTVNYPIIIDTNGNPFYGEYHRKKADGSACNKIWRMYSTDGSTYTEMHAYSLADGQVIWSFGGGTAALTLQYNGKEVLVEGQQGSTYEIGTLSGLSNGTITSKSVSFTPKIVILFNSLGIIITSGYTIAMGTNKFTIKPADVSAMGTTSPKYIAFG